MLWPLGVLLPFLLLTSCTQQEGSSLRTDLLALPAEERSAIAELLGTTLDQLYHVQLSYEGIGKRVYRSEQFPIHFTLIPNRECLQLRNQYNVPSGWAFQTENNREEQEYVGVFPTTHCQVLQDMNWHQPLLTASSDAEDLHLSFGFYERMLNPAPSGEAAQFIYKNCGNGFIGCSAHGDYELLLCNKSKDATAIQSVRTLSQLQWNDLDKVNQEKILQDFEHAILYREEDENFDGWHSSPPHEPSL